jgi:uroporphyrinogen-III synthase
MNPARNDEFIRIGVASARSPYNWDSDKRMEHLESEGIAAEVQDLQGRSVVIFRGQGGREWLRTRLEARGARVEYAECYRRARPDVDAGRLLARWQSGGIEAVSITSAEGLANLFEMLGPTGRGYLRATPVFVPHPRIALAARLRGDRSDRAGDHRTVAEWRLFC